MCGHCGQRVGSVWALWAACGQCVGTVSSVWAVCGHCWQRVGSCDPAGRRLPRNPETFQKCFTGRPRNLDINCEIRRTELTRTVKVLPRTINLLEMSRNTCMRDPEIRQRRRCGIGDTQRPPGGSRIHPKVLKIHAFPRRCRRPRNSKTIQKRFTERPRNLPEMTQKFPEITFLTDGTETTLLTSM